MIVNNLKRADSSLFLASAARSFGFGLALDVSIWAFCCMVQG